MEASLRDVSISSSLQKLFDKELLQKLYIMIDRMQEKYEDRRESSKIQEKLISMKKEEQEILEKMHEMETQLHIVNENLERMHEMETQLHVAKEALAKNLLEK